MLEDALAGLLQTTPQPKLVSRANGDPGRLLRWPWWTDRLKTFTPKGMSVGPGTPNSGLVKRIPDRCLHFDHKATDNVGNSAVILKSKTASAPQISCSGWSILATLKDTMEQEKG